MTLRNSLIAVLSFLVLGLLATPASGQRKIRSLRERAPNAIHELGRDSTPLAQRRAREAATRALRGDAAERRATDEVARAVAAANAELRIDKIRPEVRALVRQPKLKMRTTPITVDAVKSVIRRDEIIEDLGASVVRTLEGRAPLRNMNLKSELERFLDEELHITDHATVAASFDARTKVKLVELRADVTLPRLFGGGSGPLGRFYFCCVELPSSKGAPGAVARWTDARGLATPPENLLEDLALVRLPAGTKVLVGTVADNFPDVAGAPKLGGNTQIFVPAVKDFPYDHYRLAHTNSEPTDIAVKLERGVLRFQKGS